MAYGGVVQRQPIEHPWLVAALGALVAAVLATALLPLERGNVAFTLGSHCGTLLLPWALAGLALRGRRWPTWAALGGVGVVLLGLLLLVAGVRAQLDDVRAEDAAAAREQPGADASTGSAASSAEVALAAPRTIGEWRKQTDPETLRAVDQAREQLLSAPGSSVAGRPVVGVYGNGSGSAFAMAFAPGPDLLSELEADAAQGATDFLAGATGVDSPEAVDPGPLGGGAACTDGAEIPGGGVVCAWASTDASGQLTLQVPGLTVDEAVPLLQQFREALTAGAP